MGSGYGNRQDLPKIKNKICGSFCLLATFIAGAINGFTE